MRINAFLIVTICSVFFLDVAAGQDRSSGKSEETKNKPKPVSKSIFENVVRQLETRYYDKDFRNNRLPQIVEQFRPLADKAETVSEQRQVTFDLLSRIPASHLGLFSKSAYDRLMILSGGLRQWIAQELDGAAYWLGGIWLLQYEFVVITTRENENNAV